MKQYSGAARLFLWAVGALGIASVLATILMTPPPGDILPIESVLAVACLAAIAGSQKISLVRTGRYSERSCVSLGFFITIAALLAFGVRACVLVAVVSGIGAAIYPRRLPTHQLLFNLSAIALSAWATAQTFVALRGGKLGGIGLTDVGAVLLAAFIYFAVNTGSVATIMALCSNRRPWLVWRETFGWMGPSYLAGASIALTGRLLFGDLIYLVLAVPVLVFIYQAYRAYIGQLEQQAQHIEELQSGRQMLEDLFVSTVKSLASAVDAKDRGIHFHIQRVQQYAVATAERMGVEPNTLEAVRMGALLHDIGKLGVPDYVLLKPGPLTAEEYALMKRHAAIGASILASVPFPWPVQGAVLHHHERWDGNGYPEGLRETAIPLEARILAVADVYDALTSDRSYRAAWPRSKAMEYMRTHAGTQFDPDVARAFLEALPELEECLPEAIVFAPEGTALPASPEAASAARAPSDMGLPLAASVQLQRNGNELWTIYNVVQSLHAGLEMGEGLQHLSRKVASVISSQATCAVVLGQSGEAAVGSASPDRGGTLPVEAGPWLVRAVAGPEAGLFPRTSAAHSESLVGRAMREGRLYRGNCHQDAVFAGAGNPFAEAPHSVLVVPLKHGRETIGGLVLFYPAPDAYSDDDQRLLVRIADAVQTAIYHQTQLERTRIETMSDPLTGLYNIRYLTEVMAPRLDQSNDRGEWQSCVLLYLDLDHFKLVNDRFGHQFGNRVLQEAARLLKETLRPGDAIIRYGGDEFVVLLSEISVNEAKNVVVRLRRLLRERLNAFEQLESAGVNLDVSVGIASLPDDGEDLQALVAVADRQMYTEKEARRSTVAVTRGAVGAPDADTPPSATVRHIA